MHLPPFEYVRPDGVGPAATQFPAELPSFATGLGTAGATQWGMALIRFSRQSRREGLYPVNPWVARSQMAIYTSKMDISITEFKHRCLEIVRRVEKTGRPVTIRRHGKAVAQLEPSPSPVTAGMRPWEQLRALGGTLKAEPGESVLRDEDFEALR